MEHLLELYGIATATGRRRWGCRCSCGWQTVRPQRTAYYAQQRGHEHIKREEERAR